MESPQPVVATAPVRLETARVEQATTAHSDSYT